MAKKDKLIVASDAHVAKIWNRVDSVLGDRGDFHNPNKQLTSFVNQVNTSSDTLGVVFNGDSVDTHFANYGDTKLDFLGLGRLFKRPSNRETNRQLFYDSISGLNGDIEVCEVPGNHDRRLEPYSFWTWGLEHVNIPRLAHLKNAFRFGQDGCRLLGELGAVDIDDAIFAQGYKGSQSPYQKQIGTYSCIFLDSGADAFARVKNLPGFLAKSALGRRISLDAEGIDDENLACAEQALKENEDSYVFSHAPLLNTHPSNQKLGKRSKISKKRFLRSATEQGLAHMVGLRNGGKLVNALASSEGNQVVVAGHVHTPNYLLIDKGLDSDTYEVRQVDRDEFNEHLDDPKYIKHATTLPLGALPHEGEKRAGYLEIGPNGLKEIETAHYK